MLWARGGRAQRPLHGRDTAAGIGPNHARQAAQPPYERMLAGYTVEEHLPDPNVMLDFLTRLGGTSRWLTRHGVPAERLERFRSAMLAT